MLSLTHHVDSDPVHGHAGVQPLCSGSHSRCMGVITVSHSVTEGRWQRVGGGSAQQHTAVSLQHLRRQHAQAQDAVGVAPVTSHA